MIDIKLIAKTDVSPTDLSSHAAKTCYTSALPQMGDHINVEERLFRTGHHTTIQHNCFTFSMENLSVALVVFGLHLVSPYYNTDQRSGRFSKMYKEPDMEGMRAYLAHFYPNENLNAAMAFIEKGCALYAANIDRVTELAKQAIAAERPFANEKYIEQNAPKFAQEQLRVFLSQVMPTALDYTVNLSALSALYRAAWSPEMREITQTMADLVVEQFPDVAYMFEPSVRRDSNWAPELDFSNIRTADKPTLKLISANIDENNLVLSADAKDSVDLLHFAPEAMNNFINNVVTQVEISCATMGQDQRHRSIKRGVPKLTGAFYLPPLLKAAGLTDVAQTYLQEYAHLSKTMSPNLMISIAPYGMMVSYQKRADLNALIHEQAKRTCWCAQEEIYHLATQLREQLNSNALLERLAPPCYTDGKCGEGVRFCGRDLKAPQSDFFRKRVV